MSAGFILGDGRALLALDIAPMNTTRVSVKWPLGTSVDDLLSCLQDPKADKTRGIGDVDCRDATKECVATFLLLVVDGKVRDMNTTEMLLGGNSDVDEIIAIGSIGLYWILIVIGYSSSLRKNQLMNKEGGGWLLDEELDDFNRCYTGPDASTGLVSSISSAQVARIKSQGYLKQGSKFETALEIAPQVPVKWPLGTSVDDLLSYLQDLKADKSRGDSSSIQKNQVMNKEGGDWLLDDELDNFEGCYIGPHAWYSARKALVIGLKRANQMQPQGIGFIQSEIDKGVVNAEDNMVRKTVDVEDTLPRESLPAELQRATSHSMLDGELSKKHNLHKWCLLPVLHLPSWFFIFRKWLPGFQVVAAKQLREMYMLISVRGDVRAKCIMKLSHSVHGYYKPRDSMQFLPGVCKMCVVPVRTGPATNMVYLPLLSQTKRELEESESDYQYPISPITANITGDSHDIQSQQFEPCCESNNVESRQGNECRLSNVDSHQDGDSTKDDRSVISIFVRHVSGELALTVSLDQSLQHLMHLYAQKTKTKLECQYLVYGRKTLEPDHTFLFYGVERDTTVHILYQATWRNSDCRGISY
ncbi:uncharacterized protein [Setaria viridis]|uniref:uncharacterized protein n=1 Tax=Setaria viridis TaxID=4556 RepID=UPI003B3B38FC